MQDSIPYKINAVEMSGNADQTLEQLIDAHYGDVCRHAAYLTGSHEQGEEIAQEVFLRFFREPPRHPNKAAWLYKVANNMAYNYLRDRRTELRHISSEALMNRPRDMTPAVSVDNYDVEEAVVRKYETDLAKRILDGMPPRDRMCLLLKGSGYGYREIAEMTGIRFASVGKLLARSRERFLKKYSEEVGDNGLYK